MSKIKVSKCLTCGKIEVDNKYGLIIYFKNPTLRTHLVELIKSAYGDGVATHDFNLSSDLTPTSDIQENNTKSPKDPKSD